MQYTKLQSHFRSANYTAFIRRCNNFEKTDPHNGSKKQKRKYDKIKNNKPMLKILPFIGILYFKLQSSALRCFSRLKFEKRLLLILLSFIFRSKMIVHTAERTKQNILLRTSQAKSHSSMFKLLLDYNAAVINYFFTIQGNAGS